METLVSPTAQDDVRRYRELALICRQQVGLHPEAKWTWLSQAEKWEYLAEAAASGMASGRLVTVPAQKVA
jgi:hypothetical protein